MTTYRLGYPSELKRELHAVLPRQNEMHPPVVRVTPRDRAEHRCAAYDADHYEVHVYYVPKTDTDELDRLEKALGEVSGVYLTTQVRRMPGSNAVTNPEWPARLGTSRRDLGDLRPQVLALIGDTAADQGGRWLGRPVA